MHWYQKKSVKISFYVITTVFIITLVLFTVARIWLKNLTGHQELTNISIKLCGKQNKQRKLVCAPNYTFNGVTITIIGGEKSSKLPSSEIDALISRAKKIKSQITKNTLELNFKIREVETSAYYPEKKLTVGTYKYHVYKSIKI